MTVFLFALLGASDLAEPKRVEARLCPEAHAAPKKPIESRYNEKGKTVRELLGLSADVELDQRTSDWSRDQAQAALRAALKFRPLELTSRPTWAEGENLARRTASGSIGKSKARVTISDYHVCVREASGRYWFFRTLDRWRRAP